MTGEIPPKNEKPDNYDAAIQSLRGSFYHEVADWLEEQHGEADEDPWGN